MIVVASMIVEAQLVCSREQNSRRRSLQAHYEGTRADTVRMAEGQQSGRLCSSGSRVAGFAAVAVGLQEWQQWQQSGSSGRNDRDGGGHCGHTTRARGLIHSEWLPDRAEVIVSTLGPTRADTFRMTATGKKCQNKHCLSLLMEVCHTGMTHNSIKGLYRRSLPHGDDSQTLLSTSKTLPQLSIPRSRKHGDNQQLY